MMHIVGGKGHIICIITMVSHIVKFCVIICFYVQTVTTKHTIIRTSYSDFRLNHFLCILKGFVSENKGGFDNNYETTTNKVMRFCLNISNRRT